MTHISAPPDASAVAPVASVALTVARLHAPAKLATSAAFPVAHATPAAPAASVAAPVVRPAAPAAPTQLMLRLLQIL